MGVTFDEPNHLAAGLEWWQFGTYRQWTENPPLARLAVAALPYVHGQRLPPAEQWDPMLATQGNTIWKVGGDLLYAGEGAEANLARARLGTLPFYLLALLVTAALGGGTKQPGAAVIAVGLTSTLPALVAHAALATTDVAFLATFLLAVLALWRWFEAATRMRSVALGAAVALALLAKFTTLLFFPAVVLGFVAARAMARLPLRPGSPGMLAARAPWRALAVAGLSLALVTWAGYGFSVGRIADLPAHVGPVQIVPPPGERTPLEQIALELPLPMPELFHGLLFLAEHSRTPPPAYLLGQVSPRGFLAYYPVALAVKTPLPFLVLLLWGTAVLVRRWRAPELWLARAVLLGAAGLVLVAMLGRNNLGIRHVLVALPLAAIACARASTAWLSECRGTRRWLLAASGIGALIATQAGIALAACPTVLGYVNAFAARDPAAVLLDSDLDWGQDLLSLRREVRARNVARLSIAYFGVMRPCEHGLPALEPLLPGRPVTGWVAISENFYRQRNYFGLLENPCDPDSWYDPDAIPPQPFAWLRAYEPITIAGSSIRLYFIPESGQ